MSLFWRDLTTTDFSAGLGHRVAVLPVAAIEQHGPHLPVGVDSMIAEGLIDRAIAALPPDSPALFLPVQQIGKSNEHVNFPGTLTLDWDTAVRSWIEIGRSVARASLKRLLIITSHGGNNAPIDIVARELREQFGMLAVTTSWGRLGDWKGVYGHGDDYVDIHGGLAETSVMLALRPDLVRMELAEDFSSAQSNLRSRTRHLGYHTANAHIAWLSEDLSEQGPVGDASAASAELGERDIASTINGFAELIDEIAETDLPG